MRPFSCRASLSWATQGPTACGGLDAAARSAGDGAVRGRVGGASAVVAGGFLQPERLRGGGLTEAHARSPRARTRLRARGPAGRRNALAVLALGWVAGFASTHAPLPPHIRVRVRGRWGGPQ